jgi:aminoglycoside phosphotransferase (APT) family kinase protein
MTEPRASSPPGAGDAEGDVIPVREDERFEPGRLATYLRGRLEGSDRPLEVRQFGGGHANLTYLLRFGGEGGVEYVLRRPPLGPVAKGAHDMKREYRALSVLWKAFPLAPRAFLYCEDPEIIGADFFVMERRHGVVVRREIPAIFGGGEDPEANRKLSQVVIDTLARFHAVDPAAVGLEGLGRPDGFLERQVRGWTERYERARTEPVPIAEETSRWLLDHLPESPPATLLHNDWKLDNMAVAADDPGRCVAVYDWDMCTQGDPLCDLGTLLCSWVDRGESGVGPAAMPTQTVGFLTRDEAIRRYADRSGRDVSNVAYYHVFGTFKMAVVLQQIYHRYHLGQTKDDRFAAMDQGARALFELAAARRPEEREKSGDVD